jgi:hemerythrin-like domain-containing protein
MVAEAREGGDRGKPRTAAGDTAGVLDFLQGEHRYMGDLLDVLEEAAVQSDVAMHPVRYLIEDVLHYMSSYPDAVHHPVEDVLFGHLLKAAPQSGSVVRQQLREHEHIERQSRELLDRLHGLGDAADRGEHQAFSAELVAYVRRLRKHMRREEQHLFPLARTALGAREWKEVESLIEAADDPLYGRQVGERFRLLYEFLEDSADDVTGGIGRFSVAGFDALVESVDVLDQTVTRLGQAVASGLQESMRHCRHAAGVALGSEGFLPIWSAPFRLASGLLRTAAGTGSELVDVYRTGLRGVTAPYLAAFKASRKAAGGPSDGERSHARPN